MQVAALESQKRM
ncbi:hypothetical protein N499_0994A, partial [Wolbachia pipientis wVitA]